MMTDVGCSLSEEATKKLIAGVDTDGNGMIEFDEFIGIMAMRMLRNDGEAFAFGKNSHGQCNIPRLGLYCKYVAIAAGNEHTMVLMNAGSTPGLLIACGQRLQSTRLSRRIMF